MASTVHTYNPDSVLIVIGGIPITGAADGTFVEISAVSDGVSSVSGADGEIARAIGTDNRHSVNISLLQTSASNDVMSTLYSLDRKTSGGAAFPVLIQDLSGRTLFAASQAWIKKSANMNLSKGIEARQWMMETGEPAVYNIGGNS